MALVGLVKHLTTGWDMSTFERMHERAIESKLTTFDRLIFRGHLRGLFPKNAFPSFMWSQGHRLTDFARFVERATADLKCRAQDLAKTSGRPFIYVAEAATKRSGNSKEERARGIAERDGVREGLVCVFSTLEPCSTFQVRGNAATHLLEVRRARRKCLHFYFYFIDPEFGLMHVRIQSWFPFEIQVWVNGREWLARKLDAEGIAYRRHENALFAIDDPARAQLLASRLAYRKWLRLLGALAARVNPWLPRIRQAGFGGYFWVVDQCEIATDIVFQKRSDLEALVPELRRGAIDLFSADDILRFLGRRPHWALKGEVSTSLTRRPEGFRVKHRMKRNSIKVYDKWSILRIETTINNPREFKVLRSVIRNGRPARRWVPMGKSVVNLWRYAQVGEQANQRYLEALGNIRPQGKVVDSIDRLCQPRIRDGRHIPRIDPMSRPMSELFAAILAGENSLNGFRNRDLAARLDPPTRDSEQAQRRRERISRSIRRLRDHGLLAKVPSSRLYRVTPLGYTVISHVLRFRRCEHPSQLPHAA